MPLQVVNKAGKTTIPVILAVIFWFIYQGVYAVLQFGTGSVAVAYGVHIGGFVCGITLALLFGALKSASRERHLVKARRHFRNAEWVSSQGEYLNYLEYSPSDPEAHVEAARVFLCTNKKAAAADHFAKAVNLLKGKGERDRAEEVFLQAVRQIPFFKLEEGEYLDIAFGVERSLKFYRASEVYENFLNIYPYSKNIPLVLLRLAGIYKGRLEKPGKAIEYYKKILSEYSQTEWTGFAGLELEKLMRNNLSCTFG
jgi:tetratricopeptide (TPR) repeat protein